MFVEKGLGLGGGGADISEASFFSLESYQKGAAKANCNEPGWRRTLPFCIIFTDSSMKRNSKHT